MEHHHSYTKNINIYVYLFYFSQLLSIIVLINKKTQKFSLFQHLHFS